MITENKVALSLKEAYFQHILIQKEKWLSFIKDSKREEQKCDPILLRACFDILGGLPIRREIKHDVHLLTAKIMEAQINLGLEPSFKIGWNELMQVLYDDTLVSGTKWKDLK